jgi:predicted DNA-binding transcriptional regulator AlpA
VNRPEQERLVRVPEAAYLLGVKERKVWQLLSTGKFKRRKQGKKITGILLSEINTYIENLNGDRRESA